VHTEFRNTNLSDLVVDIFCEFQNISGKEIPGLSITIEGFDNDHNVYEDYETRKVIDKALKVKGMLPISTVANTIFPINLWNPDRDRSELFKRYLNVLPKIRKCPQNVYGVYFERMINYDDNGFNQLDKIVEFYQSENHRRSAFQVSIWDPIRDMVNTRMRGFPCMQHLVFSCVQNRLIVIAFYATQYIFERAYGNFLGICNLGKFLSHELGIPLYQVKCYVGVEQLSISKSSLKEIIDSL
jgi:thymidylate synthase